jgi:hypothetical protein
MMPLDAKIAYPVRRSSRVSFSSGLVKMSIVPTLNPTTPKPDPTHAALFSQSAVDAYDSLRFWW